MPAILWCRIVYKMTNPKLVKSIYNGTNSNLSFAEKEEYSEIFLKYFAAGEGRYCLMTHFHKVIKTYFFLSVMIELIEDGNNQKINPYKKYEDSICAYADSYMIKLRQLFSKNESGMAIHFYTDMIHIKPYKYFINDKQWIERNYPGGPIDKYQKLEFHSNMHFQYYRRFNFMRTQTAIAWCETPVSLSYITKTKPYIRRLARAIGNYRRLSQIDDLGYEHFNIDDIFEEIKPNYDIVIGKKICRILLKR